ncbi:MAG: hypothetical protein H7Z14_19540 [Anaerolineae bacterium]|nr:hypothetical protein [Phycisphaerae bacterium]
MSLQTQAILMLEHRGEVLATARRVSAILRDAKINGAIICGIAVFLHGYERTTTDVDVFVGGPLEAASNAMKRAGLKYNSANREFRWGKVPVQLVDEKIVQPVPIDRMQIDEVTTVSLADLINMKLRSGSNNLARSQDIAEVVGLIRANKLTGAFTSKLEKSMRAEFRKLAKAVQNDPPQN